MKVDIESADDTEVEFPAMSHLPQVEIQQLLLRGVKSEAWKIDRGIAFLHSFFASCRCWVLFLLPSPHGEAGKQD